MIWTEKQRSIAELYQAGNTFDQIVALGYVKSQVSKVINAVKAGEGPVAVKPKEVEVLAAGEAESTPDPGPLDDSAKTQAAKLTSNAKNAKIVTVVAPQPAAVVFALGSHRIELDPEDMIEAHMLYKDLKQRTGINDSFSQVMVDGIGVLWRMLVPELPTNDELTDEIEDGPGDSKAHGDGNGHHEIPAVATEAVARGVRNE